MPGHNIVQVGHEYDTMVSKRGLIGSISDPFSLPPLSYYLSISVTVLAASMEHLEVESQNREKGSRVLLESVNPPHWKSTINLILSSAQSGRNKQQ